MHDRLIFDFDGTLADTKGQVIRFLQNGWIESELANRDPDVLAAEVGDLTLPQLVFQLRIPVRRWPYLLSALQNELRQQSRQLRLVAGMDQLLHELVSRGVPCAVLSSNAPDIINEVLRNHGIDCFRNQVFSCGLLQKPLYLRRLKFRYQERLIYLGDEIRDIISCHSIGMTVAAVTWGYQSRRILSRAKPHYLLDHPQQVLGLIA